jgi:electron transport complex protein RnfD
MVNKQLLVSLSPHGKGKFKTGHIMWNVVIALIPALIASVYFFGIMALVNTIMAVGFCMIIEFLIQQFMLKTRVTALDGSAAVTGILLAYNLPVTIAWWQILIGSIVAIGIAKMTFGGLGKNPFNPALIGRAFLIASFPVDMTNWIKPIRTIFSSTSSEIFSGSANIGLVDAVTGATPLGILKEGVGSGEAVSALADKLPSHLDLFLGNVGGCIGEVSAVLIILGGLYLLLTRIIKWHIPVIYLGTLFAFTGVFWLIDPNSYADPLFHILSGGVMLGAWFMATDMVTSPMTTKGKIIFAVGGGILCGVIRLFGGYPEGCSYSILIMNAFVPLIDKYIKPIRFGRKVNYNG